MSKIKYKAIILGSVFLLNCQGKSEPSKANFSNIQATADGVTLFGEDIISTPLYERDLAISPQGNELIYTLGDYKQNKRCLVALHNENGKWINPGILNISGTYQDIEPFYSPDGNSLFFASNRPIYGDSTRTDYNIWSSDRAGESWSEPSPLDSLINTRGDEFYPAVSSNGTLYFTATREDGIGREDIFKSSSYSGNYKAPVALDSAINSTVYEFNAYVNPTETLLIFSSYGREDDMGGGDLYYSKKMDDGHWSEAQNMGPEINSEYLDYCPFVDLTNGNFYFTSERVNREKITINTPADIENTALSTLNGMGNIYRIGLNNTPLN